MSDMKGDQPPASSPLGPNVTPLLTTAIRRARLEEAEHSEVLSDLRAAELARLDMLRDALRPLVAQVPEHIDMFDLGIMPGEHPRLFVDMIAYVDMARDRRSYRFMQDTRHGRITIAESELIEPICEAVAAYMARRLIERERALISDQTVEDAAKRLIEDKRTDHLAASTQSAARDVTPARAQADKRHWFTALCSFIIFALGTFILLSLIALGAWVAWNLFMPVMFNLITPTEF
jgi:hypothetical protein